MEGGGGGGWKSASWCPPTCHGSELRDVLWSRDLDLSKCVCWGDQEGNREGTSRNWDVLTAPCLIRVVVVGTHRCRCVYGVKVDLKFVLELGICGKKGLSRDGQGGDGVTKDPQKHPPWFRKVKLPGRVHASSMSSYHLCFIAFWVLETGVGDACGVTTSASIPFLNPPSPPHKGPRSSPYPWDHAAELYPG